MITLKNLLLALCIAGASIANGQIHPLAFGPFTLGTATTNPNWYKDYVGLRFLVNSPASVAGQKVYTFAYTGGTPWGADVILPIVNTQIMMPDPSVGGDTLCATALPTGWMMGRIALVYRGGGIEFVCKAEKCADAGAVAVVIVNNVDGGPVGMGAGSVCSTTGSASTVPVFMISKADGDAIAARFRAGDTARITITPWGSGNAKDAGFVPGGIAEWHNYAIPSNQLVSTGNPHPYRMIDGAFIANYGTDDLSSVDVKSTVTFTPNETGTPAVQHTNTVSLTTFTGTASSTPDSIYAMFGTSEFDLTATGPGRFDLDYEITHSVADDFPYDNQLSTSFYLTDSLYSKGRYNFTKNEPVRTIYTSYGVSSGTEFLWGPTYYVKKGGAAISRVQYSLSNNTAGGGPLGVPTTIYLFKWVDGSGGMPLDSICQNGELTLASIGVHNYDGVNDTSGATLNFTQMGDPTTGIPTTILLEDDSWYLLAIGVPTGHYLGSDGINNPYPRIYGRYHVDNSWLEYTALLGGTADDFISGTGGHAPTTSTSTAYVNSVDSFNFDNVRGLIPAVAMIVDNDPPPIAVNEVAPTSNTILNLYPNPSKSFINVDFSLETSSKTVTYTIIDGLGRFVSKIVHNNVKDDKFTINTSDLAPGHYFLAVTTDDKALARNFVITK